MGREFNLYIQVVEKKLSAYLSQFMMKFVSKNHGLHLILDDVVENGPAWESGVRKGERTRPKCPNVAKG